MRAAWLPLLAGLWISLAAPAVQAFSLGGLFAGGAGGMVVYDPTNHLETAVTAAQSVRQTALQVQAEIQRLQQLAIELQQLRALPEEVVRAGLSDWHAQLDVLAQGSRTLATLGQQLQDTQTQAATRLRAIATLGGSPADYLAYEVAQGNNRQQMQTGLLQGQLHSLQGLQDSSAALSRLQAQIPASSGVQQSLQTTNQYLDLLVGQSSALLQLTASQAAVATRQQSVRDADSSQASAREAQRLDSDLTRIQALRSALRAREARDGLGLMQALP